MINNQPVIDDEIDLMPYVLAIIKSYKMYFIGFICAIIISLILNAILTKKYAAVSTFIMPESSQSYNVSNMSPLGSLFNQSFSSSGSSVYSSYLPALINSYRMKVFVAKEIQGIGIFDSNKFYKSIDNDEEKINFIIGHLKLNKSISLEEDPLTKLNSLKYIHENPELVLPVLNAYIKAMIKFNEILNVDSEILEIIIIDDAKYPMVHYFPKFQKLFPIVLLIIILMITMKILITKIIQDNRHKFVN